MYTIRLKVNGNQIATQGPMEWEQVQESLNQLHTEGDLTIDVTDSEGNVVLTKGGTGMTAEEAAEFIKTATFDEIRDAADNEWTSICMDTPSWEDGDPGMSWEQAGQYARSYASRWEAVAILHETLHQMEAGVESMTIELPTNEWEAMLNQIDLPTEGEAIRKLIPEYDPNDLLNWTFSNPDEWEVAAEWAGRNSSLYN